MDWDASNTNSTMPFNMKIPPLYQPVLPEHPQRKPTEDDFKMDAITTHNIDLIKYIRDMNYFLEDIDSKGKIFETSGNAKHLMSVINTALEPPPVPRNIQNNSLFSTNYSPESTSSVSCNKVFLNCKTLDPRCKMKLLQRSILVSCLIEGLTGCDQQVLDTMTDLLDNFFSTISTQFVCANLAACRATEKQRPNWHLVNLQKVLVNCGMGSLSDVLHFQELHFLDRNKRLFKLSEATYKDCLLKQENLKMQLTPGTTEISDARNINGCFSTTIKDSNWREGVNLKRTVDSISAEESFLAGYGLVEEDSEACVNPAKKPKI